ncbi:MAG: hypothetical protein GXY76_21410 [Chloroflexi bacterium]|nr:hypothetical protein [Chloroflexota bacterium]
MSRPKIVVIGAGSMLFAKQLLVGMTRVPSFQGGELCLVDLDAAKLAVIEQVARRLVAASGANLAVTASTDRRDVLPGADFVILAFADRGIHFRGLECRVSAKYGVLMHSGDTVGPGGIFRTLRTIPTALRIAGDVAELCPQAWILNYTNPTAAVGTALRRYTDCRFIALCDFHVMPQYKERLLRLCGLAGERVPQELLDAVHLKLAGVNHFTWMTDFSRGGESLFPALHQALVREEAAEPGYRAVRQLMEAFGAYPTLFWHTVEYLPYFQGRGKSPGSYVADLWDEQERWRRYDRFWADMRGYASGSLPIAELSDSIHDTEYVLRVINAILTDAGEMFYINVPNRGTVTNLPDEAVLELACRVGQGGYQRLPFGPLPEAVVGVTRPVIAEHELAVEAAVTGSRTTLLQSFLVDPLIASIEDAQNLIAELLDAERDALPKMWQH